MTTADHHAKDVQDALPVVIITVSDSRTPKTDKSGPILQDALDAAGFQVCAPVLVHDEVEPIQAAVLQAIVNGARAVVLTGGTGLAPRDVTPEAIQPLLQKELPGFGELFRQLSYAEIGPAAFMSRALAGSRGAVFIACLPGSTAAVRLAAEKLLVPQLRHILGLLAG